eukprot:TRINITY_DN21155_c0_g3_i1.p1 TRINITY_DN21155_c0_g3~~TRINITY_DN21155_c0_g3_i1.p1  ORF type:complete len:170 (+),score=19.68 TRINITY_DN21155_c0_g3_i1:43-552(+)
MARILRRVGHAERKMGLLRDIPIFCLPHLGNADQYIFQEHHMQAALGLMRRAEGAFAVAYAGASQLEVGGIGFLLKGFHHAGGEMTSPCTHLGVGLQNFRIVDLCTQTCVSSGFRIRVAQLQPVVGQDSGGMHRDQQVISAGREGSVQTDLQCGHDIGAASCVTYGPVQ